MKRTPFVFGFGIVTQTLPQNGSSFLYLFLFSDFHPMGERINSAVTLLFQCIHGFIEDSMNNSG